MSMKTEEDVRRLEKVIGRLQSLHAEISQLAKKSANDGLNKFKLKIVNGILGEADKVLAADYRPLDDFQGFDEDALPTNSDVTMILALYIEQVERFRSDNVVCVDYEWWYVINGKAGNIPSSPSTKVGAAKK